MFNNIQEWYSNNTRTLKGMLLTGAMLTGLAALVACAGPQPRVTPIKLTEGVPNTLTYVNEKGEKETVFDLNGEWEAQYGSTRRTVKIVQKENKFNGFMTNNGPHVGIDQKTIRGSINGNMIYCEIFHSELGWAGSRRNIESSNSFVCSGNEGPRTYNKIPK